MPLCEERDLFEKKVDGDIEALGSATDVSLGQAMGSWVARLGYHGVQNAHLIPCAQ
jgi:hypothetical protein